MSKVITSEEINWIMNEFDDDGNGIISYKEFVPAFIKHIFNCKKPIGHENLDYAKMNVLNTSFQGVPIHSSPLLKRHKSNNLEYI